VTPAAARAGVDKMRELAADMKRLANSPTCPCRMRLKAAEMANHADALREEYEEHVG
jgi:hypothetical protein